MKKTPILLVSTLLLSGFYFSSFAYAKVLNYKEIISNIQNPYNFSVRTKTSFTNSIGDASSMFATGYDPINKESYSNTSSKLKIGKTIKKMTSQSIQIGDHLWERSVPPGGSWKEKKVLFKKKQFLIKSLIPYIVNYHQIKGKTINGHNTNGIQFNVENKGISIVEKLTGQNFGNSSNTVKNIEIKLWIGSHNHLREIKTTETCILQNYKYFVYSKTVYYDYGKALNLTPPDKD